MNAICPTMIRTGIQVTGFRMSTEEADEFIDSYKSIYPVGRAGEVTDTSYAIEYLIDNNRASFLTGLLLAVDGGALTAGQ